MSIVLDSISGKANLAIATVPLTLLVAALPHWYSIYLAQSNKVQGGWKNENPRAFVARLNAKAAQGKRLTDLEEKILRGQSAQQNGYEWWSVWAVAVLFGYVAKLPAQDMNRYAITHVALRLVYNVAYLNLSSRGASFIRTAVFWFSLMPSITIFLKAAYKLN